MVPKQRPQIHSWQKLQSVKTIIWRDCYTLLFTELKLVKNSSFDMNKRKCRYFGNCDILTYSVPSKCQPSAATHFWILPGTDLTTWLNNSVLVLNSFTWRVITSLGSVRSVPGRIPKCVAAVAGNLRIRSRWVNDIYRNIDIYIYSCQNWSF